MVEVVNGEIVYMTILDQGQVCCGKIVPFPTPAALITLPLPLGAGDPKELMMRRACGDSLVADGIYDGDMLICTKRFNPLAIVPSNIYIVRLFESEELAKHVVFTAEGKVSLVARKSGRIDYRIIERDQVEIVAKVLYSLRSHE